MVGRDEVVAMLAQSLGRQQAGEVVDGAASKMGLRDPDYSSEQILAILEELASQPGTVGIVARFAKVRFILKTPGG
jgi:hypothetical protein